MDNQTCCRSSNTYRSRSIYKSFLRPDIHKRELHFLHLYAWKSGLKTLYYLRSEKIADADKISSNYMINSINFTNIKESIKVSILEIYNKEKMEEKEEKFVN